MLLNKYENPCSAQGKMEIRKDRTKFFGWGKKLLLYKATPYKHLPSTNDSVVCCIPSDTVKHMWIYLSSVKSDVWYM